MVKEINSINTTGVQNKKIAEDIKNKDKSDSDTIKNNKKYDSITR
jgi:hypothetical protein